MLYFYRHFLFQAETWCVRCSLCSSTLASPWPTCYSACSRSSWSANPCPGTNRIINTVLLREYNMTLWKLAKLNGCFSLLWAVPNSAFIHPVFVNLRNGAITSPYCRLSQTLHSFTLSAWTCETERLLLFTVGYPKLCIHSPCLRELAKRSGYFSLLWAIPNSVFIQFLCVNLRNGAVTSLYCGYSPIRAVTDN